MTSQSVSVELSASIWQTSRFQIDLARPRVMGIVNVTPDSFSDGGLNYLAGRGLEANTARALAHCEQLIEDGADILDIGGESSRPGAQPVSLAEELARVVPVLKQAIRLGVAISIDTYKSEVMQVALDLGADIVNDIWALRQSGCLEVVSRHASCGVCLMHMHQEPQTMQALPLAGEAVPAVRAFLGGRAQTLRAQGIAAKRIVLDPGIGFGKTVAQNFSLLANQSALLELGYPLLVGWSRKSSLAAVGSTSLAHVAQLDVLDRMVPSVAAALLSVERGARVVRVHDVRETVLALKVWQAASAGANPAD